MQVKPGDLARERKPSRSAAAAKRTVIGRRSASVSSSDLSREALEALVERAVSMAREAPEDPYSGLAPEERLLVDFAQRIRDVRQGPDGWLYVLTDSPDGQIARLELR